MLDIPKVLRLIQTPATAAYMSRRTWNLPGLCASADSWRWVSRRAAMCSLRRKGEPE